MAADDDIQYVVIPPRFLPELNKLPDDVVDLPAAVKKVRLVHLSKARLITEIT